MRNILVFSGGLFISALVLASCSSESSLHQAASLVKIVGGQPADAGSPAFTATVSLAKNGKFGLDSFCSGTLIAPNLVLTAAHCIEGLRTAKQFVVLFGKGETDPDAVTRPVLSFQSYRPNDGARFFPNFDIAWVKLEGEAPDGYQPAEILRSADQLLDLLGKEDGVLISGFGRTKTDCLATDPSCSGTRLQVKTNLRRYINSSHFWQVLVVGPKPLFGTCNGDSGGSIFAEVKGRWYVLGDLNGKNLALNSPAVWDSSRLCESGESIYNFAGAYVDWIEQSSGVTLSFDELLNPKGQGLLAIDGPEFLGTNPNLETMLRYNNPNDPLWITSEALIASFGEESKRQIPDLNFIVTDPARAAEAMQQWASFSYTGVGFDFSSFSLKDRQLRDLRPIAQLKNLQSLELIANRLTDTSMLAAMESLEQLTLSNNYDFMSKKKIAYDFSFMKKMKNLRVLNLMSNSGNLDLGSIPWASLQNLEVLNLTDNENTLTLSKIQFEVLPNLTHLIIASSGLEDISELARAKGLKRIDLRNNSIQDISVLSNLAALEEVDVSRNLIEDFSSVADLKELKELKALANPQRVKACPEGAKCLYNPDPLPAFTEYCELTCINDLEGNSDF